MVMFILCPIKMQNKYLFKQWTLFFYYFQIDFIIKMKAINILLYLVSVMLLCLNIKKQ